MKVWVVNTSWRNDIDNGNYHKIFKTKEKAKEYFEQEKKDLICDYNIEDDDEHLDIKENNIEYCTGDWDYFELNLSEEEVL